MRLIVECEHGMSEAHTQACPGNGGITDPDAILAALAEAGVLEVQEDVNSGWKRLERTRYVSPWKEAK